MYSLFKIRSKCGLSTKRLVELTWSRMVAATGAPNRGHHWVLTGGHHFVDQSSTVIDRHNAEVSYLNLARWHCTSIREILPTSVGYYQIASMHCSLSMSLQDKSSTKCVSHRLFILATNMQAVRSCLLIQPQVRNAEASSSLNHLMLLDRKLFVSGDESASYKPLLWVTHRRQ